MLQLRPLAVYYFSSMHERVTAIKSKLAAVDVPRPQRYTTGPDETLAITRQSNQFLGHVIKAFELNRNEMAFLFEIKHHMLANPTDGGEVRPSDDMLQRLYIRGVQPLAEVGSWRDESNFQVITFALHALMPAAEKRIAEMSSVNMYDRQL